MHLPIVKSLSFVLTALKLLYVRINKSQIKNLALIATVMIISGSMCLSKIASIFLPAGVVNTLSHRFNYAGLDGHLLMKSAIRYAIKTLSLHGILIKIAIDDTMRHHSKFCKTIQGVYRLFDRVIGSCCNAKCIVFSYLVINESIRFPIGWRVFEHAALKGKESKGKNAKDLKGVKKWELALELVDDAIALWVSIEAVLFDSWYCVFGMVQGLKERKVRWISEVKQAQIAEFWVKEQGNMRIFSLISIEFFLILLGEIRAVPNLNREFLE